MLSDLKGQDQPPTWDYIINMSKLTHTLEYEIISIYKTTVWNNATKIRWEGEIFNQAKLNNELRIEVDFIERYIIN